MTTTNKKIIPESPRSNAKLPSNFILTCTLLFFFHPSSSYFSSYEQNNQTVFLSSGYAG